MCRYCTGDCAHDRETDEWIVPYLSKETTVPKKRSLIDVYTDSAPHEQDAFTAALIGTMKRHGNEQQLRLLARALEDYRTPKETPTTKHPDADPDEAPAMTEVTPDSAIGQLLRLNGVEFPDSDPPGTPDVDPDEGLAKVLREAWLADDCFNGSDINFDTLARAAREHIADWRTRAQEGQLQSEKLYVRAEKAEAERDERQQRYAALRADVCQERLAGISRGTAAALDRILARDDERGQS